MKAAGNYIMLRQDPRKTSVGGILLPYAEQRGDSIGEPYSGIIESVGEDVTEYVQGEHIVFDDMCRPWVVETDDCDLIVIKDKDIICKIKDER